jgi:hypothetical protein
MEVIIIHNEQLKPYANKIANTLQSMGYLVKSIDISDYTGNQPITTVPTFFMRKAEKEGYMLKGKQPLNVLLDWAKNSGAKSN